MFICKSPFTRQKDKIFARIVSLQNCSALNTAHLTYSARSALRYKSECLACNKHSEFAAYTLSFKIQYIV